MLGSRSLSSPRWVGLAPTNNVEAGERHIAAAVGRDLQRRAAFAGLYKGEAESQLAVGVSVRRAKAALTEPEFIRSPSRPSAALDGDVGHPAPCR